MTGKVSKRTQVKLDEIGDQLRRTRRALGISRAKIATTIDMHPMNYARIEQGKQNVTVEMLLRVADGLGVELVVRFDSKKRRTT